MESWKNELSQFPRTKSNLLPCLILKGFTLTVWKPLVDSVVAVFQFTLACIKMGKPDLAQRAVNLAEERILADKWPEYYDTRSGRFIGKQARLFQTWTIAGFLTSKLLLEKPEMASLLFWEEDYGLLETCVCALNKPGRKKCSRSSSRPQAAVN